jgi:hypothetical protein
MNHAQKQVSGWRNFVFSALLFLAIPHCTVAQTNLLASADASEQSACRALLNVANLTIIQADVRNLGNSVTQYCYVRGIISPVGGENNPANWIARNFACR